jgi:hypothetical protein
MKTILYSTKAALFIPVLACLFSLQLKAQTDFNLSDYKNPDYQYRSLDFGLGLTGNNSINKKDYPYNYSNKINNNSFNGNLTSNYFSIKNSEYYQGSQNYWFNFSTFGSNNKTEAGSSTISESTYKQNSQYLSIGVNSSNRFYNSKKRFIETNLIFSGELGNLTNKTTSDTKTYPYNYKNQSGNYRMSASIPLLVGTGRIEEVQDARLAVYILDDLLKSGDLTRTPDKEEILALSEFITQTKNQRFFDSRIRKIAEITAIDSFLTANGLKGQSDASYYTLINDNWDNSNGPVRATGRRFSIGITPGFSTEFDKSIDYSVDTTSSTAFSYLKSKNTDQLDSWNLDAIAQFVCERPINLTWQRSTTASMGYSLYNSNSIYKTYNDDVLTVEIKESEKTPNFSVGITHSYGYYPNSRTSIKFGANAFLQQYWHDRKTDDGLTINNDETNINSNLFLNCNYYFSPQLRFSVYINEAYQFTKEIVNGTEGNPNDIIKENYFTSHINASITYSLF